MEIRTRISNSKIHCHDSMTHDHDDHRIFSIPSRNFYLSTFKWISGFPFGILAKNQNVHVVVVDNTKSVIFWHVTSVAMSPTRRHSQKSAFNPFVICIIIFISFFRDRNEFGSSLVGLYVRDEKKNEKKNKCFAAVG